MRRALIKAIAFYWESGVAAQAPALAFYLVAWLVPLAMGLTALAMMFFGDILGPDQLTRELAGKFPPQVRDPIIDLASSAQRHSPRLLVLSVATMIWTSSAAIGVVERTMTAILNGPPFGIVWGKVRLLLLGAGFALAVCAGGALVTLTAGVFPLPAWGVVVLNSIGLVGLVALIYRYAPSRRLRLEDCLVGALPAVATLQLTPLLVGLYFTYAARLTPGGIFFSMAVVLVSCFVMAQGTLIGAAISANRSRNSAVRGADQPSSVSSSTPGPE